MVNFGRMGSYINELSYAAPTLIGLFTIPTAWRFVKNFKQPRSSTNHEALYEDKDGVATEESMAKHSTRRQFVIIFTSLIVGLLVSFGLAILATVEKSKGFSDLCLKQLWLLFVSWVSLTDLVYEIEFLLTNLRLLPFFRYWKLQENLILY